MVPPTYRGGLGGGVTDPTGLLSQEALVNGCVLCYHPSNTGDVHLVISSIGITGDSYMVV